MDALDLNHLETGISEIPEQGEVRIIGEGQLSHSNFELLKSLNRDKNLISQRASVRTALSDPETAKLVDFVAFNIQIPGKTLSATMIYYLLEKWGFKTPKYLVVKTGDEVLEAVKKLATIYESYEYKADGVVVRADTGGDLKAVRIYNWEEPILHSYVTGLEEPFNSMYLGCVLQIFPVFTGNSYQRQITITNVGRMEDYELYTGAPIAFTIVSGAIADVDLGITMELHKVWEGKFDAYREMVEFEEEKKSLRLRGGN